MTDVVGRHSVAKRDAWLVAEAGAYLASVAIVAWLVVETLRGLGF